MENYDHQQNKSQIKLALYSWPPCRILIISGPGSGKTNVLLNLIKHQQSDFDKIYLYVKGPFELMYQ